MQDLKISLAAARVNKKMTQEEVAKALGVSKSTVVAWENDKRYPNAKQMSDMANLYGISIENIFLK